MQTGQFVKGIFNGSTESYQTEKVEKLLSPEEFDRLWNLERLGSWIYTNPEEGAVARSTITRTSDGAFTGRKGIINHTVIVKFDKVTVKDGATYALDKSSVNDELARNTPALNSPFPPLTQPLPPVGGDT
jgi:hypothetical protein